MIDTSESVNRVPPGNDGALGALRAATAERHELLHVIMPLSVESVALRDYLAHLAILRDWLEPLEAWLENFDDGPQASTLPARIDRLALLDADLAHAAARRQDERINVTAPTRMATWRGAQSAAYRWGVCYVIEGSQLGGAVLYARLKDRLAPHPLSYLAAGRETLGSRWQAFIRALAADIHTPATIDEACRGAADAFDRLIELAQCPTLAACANVD